MIVESIVLSITDCIPFLSSVQYSPNMAHPFGQISHCHSPVLLVKNPERHDLGSSLPSGQCSPMGHMILFALSDPKTYLNFCEKN
jgi:hypothetical protein